MTFLQALGGVLSLLLVALTGFFLAFFGMVPQACVRVLPRFITNVSLPPFLACTIISSLGHENLYHLIYGAALPFIQMALLFILAYRAARLIRVPSKRFGLFCACVSNPNTIFIGIPVTMALFGEGAVVYVLLYYFASTCFFWTAGNYFISRDEPAGGDNARPAQGGRLKKIVSAPMIGFLCGACVIILDIPYPAFLFQGASLLGQMTTPLALIFIGITLQGINWKGFRLSRDLVLALAGRMVISPLLMALLLDFADLPPVMKNVFIIQAALPVVLQAAILSAYYQTDPEFGSLMVSLSTILCALTIPLCMSLIC